MCEQEARVKNKLTKIKEGNLNQKRKLKAKDRIHKQSDDEYAK